MRARFTTQVVDLDQDSPARRRIVDKIIGLPAAARDGSMTLLDTMRRYQAAREIGTHRWSTIKSIQASHAKNAWMARFLPARVGTLMDFGCGSGVDVAAILEKHAVGQVICADIRDNRDPGLVKGDVASFLQVTPGAPLPVPAGSIDVIVLFHVIHHMADAGSRLADLARALRPGGVLLVKDHDVVSREDADNVTFEHLVYEASVSDAPVEELALGYPRIEPMWFYSAGEVRGRLTGAGLREAGALSNPDSPTRVYQGAYEKPART